MNKSQLRMNEDDIRANIKILGPQGTFEKDARSYLTEDFAVGWTLYPATVKLRDADCWTYYKGNEWVLSTVNRITRDCRKAVPKVVPKVHGTQIGRRMAQRIIQVERFFERPNTNKEGFFEIREKFIRDLLIVGRGCIEKVVKPISRMVTEIYNVDACQLKLMADQHGTLRKKDTYRLQSIRAKEDVYFDFDEMMFVCLDASTRSMYGVKILDGIANSVAADILRSTFNSNYFVNGAAADGILGLEGLPDKALQKFRTYWKENFKGAKNSHKTAVINVPIKYIQMAMTNRDLQFAEYGTELRTKIFAAYNMPPFIMGIVDATTGKLNSGQQVELYKDGALRPILEKESYYYTHELIEMGFGFTDIMVKFPSVDLIDVATQAEMDRSDAEAGIITINEIRSSRGKDNVPWGDTPVSLAPGGGQIDPETGKIIPPSQQDNGKPAPKKLKKPSKKEISDYINMFKIKIQMVLNQDVEIIEKLSLINTIIKEEIDSFMNDDLFFMFMIQKAKNVVYKNFLSGRVGNIVSEIDNLLNKEIKDE